MQQGFNNSVKLDPWIKSSQRGVLDFPFCMKGACKLTKQSVSSGLRYARREDEW